MSAFYSQHGEDFLLNKIFRGKSDGYFVEVGCLDGIEYSNTYYFEKKGWRGACVEAHNDFIDALRANRPGSSVIHCAVGEDNVPSVTFYANIAGSLSTLDKSEEARWRANYSKDFHGFQEQRVPMRTLTSIFDELQVEKIDFVSLDIEGYEVKALTGLDFSKYLPKVFVIEFKNKEHKKQLDDILLKQGYFFLSQVGCNLLYSLDFADKKILDADHGAVSLVKVDASGVQHIRQVILTKPSRFRKFKSMLGSTILGRIWKLFRRTTESKSSN
jgi:FkbM family methyltransferase